MAGWNGNIPTPKGTTEPYRSIYYNQTNSSKQGSATSSIGLTTSKSPYHPDRRSTQPDHNTNFTGQSGYGFSSGLGSGSDQGFAGHRYNAFGGGGGGKPNESSLGFSSGGVPSYGYPSPFTVPPKPSSEQRYTANAASTVSSEGSSLGFCKPPPSTSYTSNPMKTPIRVGGDPSAVGFVACISTNYRKRDDDSQENTTAITDDGRYGDYLRDDKSMGRSRAPAEKFMNKCRNITQGRLFLSQFKCRFKAPNGTYQHISPFGERGSGLQGRGQEVQDFESIRNACLEEGRLFEDPDFPAVDQSIFFSKRPPKPFEWKRPHEITDAPELFIDGASRFDVKQGELGDCWLLAAVANLTLNRRLFYQIVPSDQSFGDNYAGVFHFRFWQYGRWVDVVIDDLLPTFYGKLVFMHSDERNEFWSALLEKAYAKLHGSYEALKGGTTCEAMEDFTGGVSELYDLTKAPPNLFSIMLKSYERGSLMGCSLEPDPNVTEARCDNGLIRGHAYSITCVKYCEIQTPRVAGKIPLVRIRNPWGNEAEWTGPWSDQSPEWQYIPAEEKEEMGLTFEHDGEFWMAYKDFIVEFGTLEMTNLSPDSLTDEDVMSSTQHKWEMSVYEGAWIRGSTAGGCRNFLDSFWHNPQYRITLTEVDDDDQDNKCTVIVAVMQKNRRSQRKLGLECLTIGFAIYHLRDPDSLPRPLDQNFFKYNASVARSPSFINMREVSCRFKLPPGTYCIVPSTFEPHDEGEFILRVFSEKANVMEENDEQVGFGQVDERVQPASEEEQAESDERIRGFFGKVAGEDLEIDWSELQNVLNYAMKREFTFDGFSKDVCRSMISMMDVDRSGKLGLREFIRLWTDIRTWKNCFKLYDKDNSSMLCGFELRAALTSAGYRLNNHISNALMLRYGNKEGQVTFDDFIMCSVKLRTMMGIPGVDEAPTEEAVEEFYTSIMKEIEEQEALAAEEEQQEAEEEEE